MKRKTILGFLIICLFFEGLSLRLWAVNTETQEDTQKLWTQKAEYEKDEIPDDGVQEGFLRECYFVDSAQTLTVLLYTDAVQELSFQRRVYVDDSGGNGPFWSNLGELGMFYLPRLLNDGFVEEASYLVSPELEAILAERCLLNESDALNSKGSIYLPYLRGCIEAFDISKEELIAACEKSRSDPDSIRTVLSVFSDEEFALLKSKGVLSCDLDQTYLIDALYLDDEQEMRALCMKPFAANADGMTVTYSDVVNERIEVQQLKMLNIRTNSFWIFLKNAIACVENQYDPMDEAYKTNMELFNELSLVAAPPKTGDPTAAYALIFTLAALPLAGFGVYEWKRRRRAV